MERLRRALRGEGLPIGEALHPLTLLSVGILVLNDWFLKPRFRGSFVTGKLSDVAGLVFAPVVLTAVIGLVLRKPLTHRRLVLACAATAIGFSLTKLVPAIGDVVARMIGHGASFYPDWTDVLCTPFVLVAYWIGRDELRLLARPAVAE
ncbi:MAG TPA: hypothetical protein VGC41_05565 [Kofleriaceae bacterium]